MDGAYPIETTKDPPPIDTLKFVEVKTNRAFEEGHYDQFFKEKMLNWWSKGVLVGANDIIIGLRDHRGIVEKISLASLPDLVDKCSKVFIIWQN